MSTPTDTTRRSDAAVALTGGLVALLVLVSAMPPLGTAAYLAGLPIAAEDLGITTESDSVAAYTAWYNYSNAGMGICLTMAEELGGYILSDKATYLTFRANGGIMD